MLRDWHGSGLPLGIASNAQAYTSHELAAHLGAAGLEPGIFAPDLVLWSWQLGFSKPDPYFFQTLVARLAARGLDPAEVLMVGDRADNDMAPARAAGLMTWHLHPQGDGDWCVLRDALSRPR
jgi:putative hydrolase of the HAD superfamily